MAKTKKDTPKRKGDVVLSREKTDNPKLCAQFLAGGQWSLYLSYYLGYQKVFNPITRKETIKHSRQKRFLNLYLYDNPRTPDERQRNRETTELAKQIRFESEQELKRRETGFRIPQRADVDFLAYYRDYIENYTKKDIRILELSYKRFTDFLRDTPKYNALANKVKPKQMDKDMITAFVEYLQRRSYGTGANTLYSRFKKVVKNAVEHDVFIKNPCEGVTIKTDRDALTKAFLSMEEIEALVNTPFQGNQNIKRAFLFCLYTGLRWCDVKDLTFGNIDFSNRLLSFSQRKTEGHSTHSNVTTPLTASTLALIGERGEDDAKIFVLPSYELCLRYVKMWVGDAGIKKHISWHCARHTFAVTLISSGKDIQTVKSLMGHSKISMTERYLHVVDELKKDAVEVFPVLNPKNI